MKRKKAYGFIKHVILTVIVGLLGVFLLRSLLFSYDANVKGYERITSTQIESLPTNSLIYIGRKSCPICNAFIPKFNDVLAQLAKKPPIYYLDTDQEKISHRNELQSFIKKENIHYVPTLVIKKGTNLKKKSFDANSSLDEIQKFIK